MRKSIYTLLLLLCCTAAMAQVAPALPITQLNQNSVYIENITKDRYLFHGKDALGHPIWTRIPFVLSPNTVISGLGMSVFGSVLTVQPGYWRITNVLFHTTTTTNFTLQPQDSVLSRYETVYADSANTLHIAVGSLSLNPVEPNIPSGDLRVGAALIQPLSATTPVIITQPGTITDYVFTHPKTKQADAYPKVRSITADSIMTPFYILPVTAPHSGDVIQAAGDGTTFWSPQAIYNQGTGILISSNIVKADTILLVTQRALLDTLKTHAAVFNPGQFTVINDTISFIGSGTVHTGNGISGDGSSGTPVILGGPLNQNTTITTGATNIFQVSSISGLNIATVQIQSGILQNTITRSGHGEAFSSYSVSGSDPLSQLGYEDNLGTGFKTISFGIVNKGAFLLDSKTNLGILFASDYSTNQRANLNSAASVKTVKLLIDSATATGVASVFGRTGAVVAATNDYTFAQIGSKPTTLSGYGITDAVPSSRTITINGTAFDLSADRSWTVGSTITPVSGETPTGLMNGSNVTFISAHTPIAGSLSIVYNGLILQPTVDYTFSGTTATLVLTGHLSGAPVSTDYLLFNYQY